MSSVKCFLKSVEGKHEPIPLTHGEEILFGRGPESKIYENRCSRRQIKIIADCEKREVNITQLGRNASAVNGMSISKDQTVTAKEGDRIELLIGQFVYTIEFDPPPEDETSETAQKTDTESERLDTESGRFDTESVRLDTESVRFDTESGRFDTESGRFDTEPGRFDTESVRLDTESGRLDTESGRFDTEPGRFDTESVRLDTESGRLDTESGRFDTESGRLDTESTSESRKDPVSDSEEGDTYEPESKKSKTTKESEEEMNDSAGAWESVDDGKLLVYTHAKVEPSTMIASYDLDWTLIGTKSGVTFPKNKDDWKILYPSVLTKLKEMHENKFKIVIFTNQATLASSRTNEANFKNKIENIVKKIDVPVQLFSATGHSYYRKPAIGMWDALKERNGGLEIDMEKSFYCGDAAGREAGGPQKKKDFSHSDLLFAKNLNLRFETPEYHFLNKEMQPLRTTVFDPNTIPCDIPLCTPSWGQVISNKLELIILVGCPGSGKSHFAKTHLIPAGYVHVNRDTLGSWNKCVNVMESALKSKQRVVVDNTNPDVESRRRYITIAKHYTTFVRCFIMNTSFLHAKHNNKFRQLTDPSHAVITDLIMNTYKAKYKEPTMDEGFTEILRINFWPTFKDPKYEKLYKLFLLEK